MVTGYPTAEETVSKHIRIACESSGNNISPIVHQEIIPYPSKLEWATEGLISREKVLLRQTPELWGTEAWQSLSNSIMPSKDRRGGSPFTFVRSHRDLTYNFEYCPALKNVKTTPMTCKMLFCGA